MSLLGTGERAASEIAQRQRTLLTAEQAAIAGLGRKTVAKRVRDGTWRRVHRQVFAVGAGDLTHGTAVLAAVLACRSPGAVASHLSAGWLWGIVERWPGLVEITPLGGRNPGELRGVSVHRSLRPPRWQWRNGIPLASPVDTLLDLATILDPDELEAAVARAVRSGLVSRAQLREAEPRPGIVALRQAAADPALTRSGNERLLVSLLRQAELSGFDTNVVVEGKELDVYWPEAKLAIEVDAYGTHGDAATFEDDHLLDADFEAAGIKLLRFTGRRIRARPHAVTARIAAALTQRLGGLPVPRRRR